LPLHGSDDIWDLGIVEHIPDDGHTPSPKSVDRPSHPLRTFAIDIDHRYIAACAGQNSRCAFAHALATADNHGFLVGQAKEGRFHCHRSPRYLTASRLSKHTPPAMVTVRWIAGIAPPNFMSIALP
jgi:hypothetical protein